MFVHSNFKTQKMAAYVNSLLNKGSDTMQDYCCTACEERNIIIDAVSYCKRCAKYFCDKCNTPHKTLYDHHSVLGRGDLDRWPVAKVTVDIVEKCLEHPEEKIKLFCYGHGQICCNTCVSLYHRTCGEVKLITDSGTIPKSKKLSKLKSKSKKIQRRLTTAEKGRGTYLKELESSYENMLFEIEAFRDHIVSDLNALVHATKQELRSLRDELKTLLEKDVIICAQLRESLSISCDVMDDVGEKSRTLMFIAEQKTIMLFEQADNLLHDISVKGKCSLLFKQNDGIRQSLRDFKRIGQIIKQTPNEIIECKRSRRYNVRMKDDIEDVLITGICESTNGQYIICDSRNKKLKLLDSAFQIISSLKVPGCIHGITNVDATKLVCSVSGKKLNLLYFVAVNIEGLEIVNYTDLPHDCRGICRRDEELYVSSIDVLYVYTLAGEVLRKIDVNESIHSVHRCALSLDGTRIYVTADDSTELVTLSNDGSLLSTFTDSEQRKMGSVHVTHNGQVLVCCWEDNSVIQLHNDGREQLAVLVTNGDGLYDPQTVYYSHATNKVIVGFNGDEIMVLDVK